MKGEIYNALAAVNRGFDLVAESLAILREKKILTTQYAQSQEVAVGELRAGINQKIVEKLHEREMEDWARLGKMRSAIEARMK
ncbi:MAG TPA: hypothetical protein VKE71_07970 [Candidatus Angelobacter sp.]|nr:hypothetical protein [Candidatus Angelobacter sp.]